LLPIGLTLEFVTFLCVGTVTSRDRPDVTPLGSVPSTSSFPSGHVAAAVVLYGGLAIIVASFAPGARRRRNGAIAASAVVVFVAMARLYEGVHHPTDLLGGLVLGTGALLGATWCAGLGPAVRGGDEPSGPVVQRVEVSTP
jgi:membrane-associated phospholipid phosphatase